MVRIRARNLNILVNVILIDFWFWSSGDFM